MATDTASAAQRKPLEYYRELFPITRERVYFNHAALGTTSTPVMQAVSEHMDRHSRLGSAIVAPCKADLQRIRGKMAAFVGAEPAEMAVTMNTPHALSLVAAGLPWQSGDRIIISDQEFPANVYPWLNLGKLGVETVMIRSREGCVPTEDVIEAIDQRTRLVSLSWVEFSTGYRNDLRAIGQACHEKGALLATDVIQGLGALQMDVRELNVDFFGTSCHKWLLGPLAVGWLFCRRELLDRLDLMTVGQSSYQRDPETSLLEYDLKFWPDARRFEPGIGNFAALAGVAAAVDLLTEVGTDRVEAQIKHITDRLAGGLLERGYRLAARRDGIHWSGIVSFSSDRHRSQDLIKRLDEAGVSATLREGRVRLAPHFYNNDEDVDRFFAALP